MSLRLHTRYSLIIIAMISVIAGCLSVALIVQFRDASRQINQEQNALLSKQLIAGAAEQAVNVAEQLAENLANPLYRGDLSALQDLLEVAKAHPAVDSAVVIDSRLRIVQNGGGNGQSLGERVSLSQLERDRLARGEASVHSGDRVIEITQPIRAGDQLLGAIRLHYSLATINDTIGQLQAVVSEKESKSFANLVQSSVLFTLLLVIFGIVATLYIVRFFQQPIAKLVLFANEMGKGMFSHKVEVGRDDELGELATSLNEMAVRLDDRTKEIQFLAFHDGLTKLPNRDYFKSCLGDAIVRAKRDRSGFSLLFIDIDNFKLINDVYGHAAGDFILVSLAERIQDCLRQADASGQSSKCPQSLLGRLAGDEFIALLEGANNKADAAAVSVRILDKVSQPYQWKSNSVSLGISIGIAIFPENGSDVESLLRNADAAMYHVKKRGKNDFHFFSPELDRQAHERLALLEELGTAIRDHQMELWYQPQFDLVTGKLMGAEALRRWNHPTKGIILPDKFISLAERSVHSYELGAWIIREATSQLRLWHRLRPQLCLGLNISPLQLQRRDWLLDQLAIAAPDKDFAARIDLEITENFIIKGEDAAAETLNELKAMGFHIWLDDFGTGFSSLNHLRRFPVDGVKIDKTYVSDMVWHHESRSLTRAIVQVAKAFGIRVIAEGVETPQQEAMLKHMGCTLGQGFLYSKPMPAESFGEFLLAHSPLQFGTVIEDLEGWDDWEQVAVGGQLR